VRKLEKVARLEQWDGSVGEGWELEVEASLAPAGTPELRASISSWFRRAPRHRFTPSNLSDPTAKLSYWPRTPHTFCRVAINRRDAFCGYIATVVPFESILAA